MKLRCPCPRRYAAVVAPLVVLSACDSSDDDEPDVVPAAGPSGVERTRIDIVPMGETIVVTTRVTLRTSFFLPNL